MPKYDFKEGPWKYRRTGSSKIFEVYSEKDGYPICSTHDTASTKPYGMTDVKTNKANVNLIQYLPKIIDSFIDLLIDSINEHQGGYRRFKKHWRVYHSEQIDILEKALNRPIESILNLKETENKQENTDG